MMIIMNSNIENDDELVFEYIEDELDYLLDQAYAGRVYQFDNERNNDTRSEM